ncbi:MAG TPA: YciI family protein [Rhodothermales bacterium]|nr:YciI family protein [Rhodothermales bacterium]
MRVMVLIKANEDSETGVLPSEQLLTEMGQFNEELVKAGVMLAGEGLHPSSKAKRVRFSDGRKSVIDGPFAETKELIAGFWLWQVRSMEEAVEWVRRMPNTGNEEATVEIRPVFEAEDFGEEFTPELREQEERLREQSAAQQKGAQPQRNGAAQNIFVNLPVEDLDRSVTFFKELGYTFNAQFTDENATCMVVGDNIYVMLLIEKFFKTLTPKPIVDAKRGNETCVGLSAESREAVDRVVEMALAAGARRFEDPADYGFMYQWGFEDLDGHIWNYIWMDPAHVQQ